MQTVNKTTAALLETLTKDMAPGDSAKIDNAGGAFMALHVDCIAPSFYRLAHYFTQNGDLMSDPEVIFWRSPLADEPGFGPAKAWVPTEIIMHATGYRRVAVNFDENNQPESFAPRVARDLASFCNAWVKNIKRQQNIKVSRKAGDAPKRAPELKTTAAPMFRADALGQMAMVF